MTDPQFDFAVRSLVLKPVSTAGGVAAKIVAGRGPRDRVEEFWLPAGVHQVVIDFDEDRWMSLYIGSRMLFGMKGPHSARMVRIIMEKAGWVKMYVSTADPTSPTLVGLTVFQLPAE